MRLDSDAILWSAPERERAGRPLLVLLHGLGSHEGDLFSLAPRLPLEFVIASVRAPLPEPPGYAWFARDAAPVLEERVTAAAEGADAFAAWLAPVASSATGVGLLGFSQGAMISLLTLRRHPGLVDFAVLLAGGAFPRAEDGDAELAERRPPVFLGYGLDDLVVPHRMFEYTAEWLPGHAEATVRAYPKLGHGVSEDEVDDVVGFLRGWV